MAEEQESEGRLSEEFRELGKNLKEVLETAWERPERKRLQQEIANGLDELGDTLQEEAHKFSESPTGTRLKTEAQEFGQRIRSGEVEARVRNELVSALQSVNRQLQNLIDRWSEERPDTYKSQPGPESATTPGPEHREVHPDDATAPPAETGHEEVHPDDVNSGSSSNIP